MKTLISIVLGVFIWGMNLMDHSPNNVILPNQINSCDSFFFDLAHNWKYDTVKHLYIASTAFEKWDYRKCFENFSQKDILQCLGEPNMISLDSQIYYYNTIEFYGSENNFRLKKLDMKNPYHQSFIACKQIRFIFDNTKKFSRIELNSIEDKNIYNVYSKIQIKEESDIKKRWFYNEKENVYIWKGDMFSSHLNKKDSNSMFDKVKLNEDNIIRLFGMPTIQNDSMITYKIRSEFQLLGLDSYKRSSGHWIINLNKNNKDIKMWYFQLEVSPKAKEFDCQWKQ